MPIYDRGRSFECLQRFATRAWKNLAGGAAGRLERPFWGHGRAWGVGVTVGGNKLWPGVSFWDLWTDLGSFGFAEIIRNPSSYVASKVSLQEASDEDDHSVQETYGGRLVIISRGGCLFVQLFGKYPQGLR